MTEILLFRICLFLLFLIAVFKTGDWKSWQKYYPTVLFVIVVNLVASNYFYLSFKVPKGPFPLLLYLFLGTVVC